MFKMFKMMFVFGMLGMFIIVIGSRNNKQTSQKDFTQETPKENSKLDPDIPGLMPVDIYLNLEGRGYKTKKDFTYFPTWFCNKEIGMTTYHVAFYGNTASTVRRVDASFATTIDKDSNAIAMPEFVYLASLPYDGAEPQKSQEWVRNNLGQNAKTIIGGVVFELEAPTKNGRLLSIYPEEQ